MRFAAAALLPALALGANLYQNITNDLTAITNALIAVNQSVTALPTNGSLQIGAALALEGKTSTLGEALKQGIADSNATSNLNKKQSTAIAKQVLALISPVKSVVNNLVAHKATFQTGFALGDLSKTTYQILTVEKNLTATFGATLGPKLAAPYNGVAPQITAQLVGLFQPGLDAFATCGGKGLCLPPIIFGDGNKLD